MKRAAVILLVFAVGCSAQRQSGLADASAPTTQPTEDQRAKVDRAIEKGVEYLVQSQNPDGSWGKGMLTDGFLVLFSLVPGTHDACRVGTTALCAMALREAGEKEAHAKAVEYLIEHGQARRDLPDLMYNIWAHIYTVEALSAEMQTNKDPRIPKAIAWHIDYLTRYEDYRGGWNYYDFEVGAQRPAGTPVSFGTAAGLAALWQAKEAGIEVPEKMYRRAIRATERMRLPNGAYLYGEYLEYSPRHPANMPRGSIGRTQTCNYAMVLCGSTRIGVPEAKEGLEIFVREHNFIEMGRKRPYPHDSWYATAPYYYYFDHYYAVKLAEKLGRAEQEKYGKRIADWIVPLQEEDGSWFDFPMWDYHRPYGTAFAVMTLLRCR